MKEKKPKEKDASKDLLKQAKEDFAEADDLWRDNMAAWLEDAKFRNREQWPEKVKKERDRTGRPTLVCDELEQYVRQVVNDGRMNRPSPKVSPIDDAGDLKVADAFKGMIRSICNKSNADQAFDTALEHAAACGFGFFRVVTQYEHAKTFNQEIGVKRVRNPMAIRLGVTLEADGSDAKVGFVLDDVRKAEFKRLYPKAKMVSWNADGFQEGWSTDKTVRVCEYFYTVEEMETVHLLDDGSTATAEEYEKDARPVQGMEMGEMMGEEIEYKPAIVESREIPVPKVKWCRFSGCEVLEENEWAGRYIPIIPVFGVERDINGKVTYEGLIRPAKDPQRLYNYSRSGFAEHVSLSTKQPMVAAAGQIEGFENEWKKSNIENIAVLHYNPVDVAGHPVPPPFRAPATNMPVALVQDMQQARSDIQAAIGMYDAAIGQRSNEKSGVAINARDRQSDVGTFHYHDNLNRAIRYLCRQFVDLIPKIYDSRRVVRLLGEDGKPTMAMIDPELGKANEERNGMQVYNLGAGKYDVEVEAGASYTTRRQEAAEGMLQLTQANPEMWRTHGDLIAESQDWPNAEKFAKRSKLTLPPEILAAEKDSEEQQIPIAQYEKLHKDAEQAIAEREQALQQAEQHIAGLEQELKNKDAEAAAKLADSGTKRYEAQTERIQTMAPAITPELIKQIADMTAEAVLSRVVESPQQPPPPPQAAFPEPGPEPGFFMPEGA